MGLRSISNPAARRRSGRPIALVALGLAFSMVLAVAVSAPPYDGTVEAATPVAARLVDTRPNGTTVDGALAATGPLGAGATLEIPVTGRVATGSDPAAAVLTVTAIRPSAPGYAVVFECGTERPDTSNLNYRPGDVVAVLAVAPLDERGRACVFVASSTHLVVDADLALDANDSDATGLPLRIADTRPDGATFDGVLVGGGPLTDATLRVPVAARSSVADQRLVLSLTAVAATRPGYLLAHRCGDPPAVASTLNFSPGDTIANAAFVDLDGGDLCVTAVGSAHVIVDVVATLPAAQLRPSARLLDTRSGGTTVDGAFSGIGVRPSRSSTELQLVGRAGVPADAGAAILNVTAVAARETGHLTVHAGSRPGTSSLNYGAGETIANAVIAPIDESGRTCIYHRGATDLVVDVVGWLPGAPTPAPSTCPSADPLFPGRRLVALYGNDVDSRLGVLGEQPPTAAADRLATIAEPYRTGERRVQGAFELIATIATSAPGPSGLYRSPSTASHVQRYLDVADDRGLLLILDIQPGQSDFLTEVQRYDDFLREPNVHVALDPEWNVDAGQVPGELVGQVDALEVNAVADYLATIVEEESLPEKMLVVHQFQDRMLTRRELLREPDGVAIVIHMDGFGTQEQKLSTYEVVAAEPPLNNGFKLFFDEDVDRFEPSEVLALDPVPDLITYQ